MWIITTGIFYYSQRIWKNCNSSIVNEGIRAVLNLFIIFFFYKKILHAQKAQNAQKA